MDKRCHNCRFWEREPYQPTALYHMAGCHRRSGGKYSYWYAEGSGVLDPRGYDSPFPLTKGTDWCGEWEARGE